MDLSRIRHDLRTPINHIIGYCEMLLEDEELPESFHKDLKKVHSGGRQLMRLISEYFNEDAFDEKRKDLAALYHNLRTPVNYILGYTEMLQEQAQDEQLTSRIPDLQKIHLAASNWLDLMEEHLLPADRETFDSGTTTEMENVAPDILEPGVGYQTPLAHSATLKTTGVGRILVVDDDANNREMLVRRVEKQGYIVVTADSGLQALKKLRSQDIDLVLLDLIMPGIDGYQVLSRMKSDSKLRHIPVIMISALDQENGIARCIELGAEDYLSKPFNPVFLRARVGASLEKKLLRDQERRTYEALVESQTKLAGELAEAGAYVKSLLPPPLTGDIRIEYSFKPSEQLGGDAFGYHWIDDDHFAIYLLDVCGHGVGAALLSISVLNVLRAQSLPGVDFNNPAEVLSGLNRTFKMENQNNMYFTIWFGVFNRSSRELVYSSGGHPPALLFTHKDGDRPPDQLKTSNPIIGFMDESEYRNESCTITEDSCFYVFSDGVYEIPRENAGVMSLEEFAGHLKLSANTPSGHPEEIYNYIEKLNTDPELEDDFSIMRISL